MTIDEYNKSVDLFSDNVYRFILKNAKDEALAQDVVQDSYEKLWMNYGNVQFEKVKSYLFTTAYRTMIDHFRRSKKITNTKDYDYNGHYHNEQYSDISEILQQAVSQLPDDQKAAIMLRDYEGYSYKEIAEITGLNESQVKVYIYRARVFLKNYIVKVENVA
ncbi:MAG: RNA polymerase sigma factor [Chloroflexia bacterium]|nr:RNA polymerase sigma factor [Chloroflexia bacterium]